MTAELARCTAERACPWRWRTGAPRPCPLHADSEHQLAERAADFGAVMTAAPGDQTANTRSDGDH
jgi:hypothetical protein